MFIMFVFRPNIVFYVWDPYFNELFEFQFVVLFPPCPLD